MHILGLGEASTRAKVFEEENNRLNREENIKDFFLIFFCNFLFFYVLT